MELAHLCATDRNNLLFCPLKCFPTLQGPTQTPVLERSLFQLLQRPLHSSSSGAPVLLLCLRCHFPCSRTDLRRGITGALGTSHLAFLIPKHGGIWVLVPRSK